MSRVAVAWSDAAADIFVHFEHPLKKWRQTMSNFVMLRTTLILMVLLLSIPFFASDRSLAANNLPDDEYDIVGGWSWEWRNNTGSSVKACPGGNGKITVTFEDGKRTLSFNGKVRDADGKFGDSFTKGGKWEYLGKDPNYNNRRKYRFNWGNDSDVVIMSDSGTAIVGSNGNGLGKCRVKGTK